MLDTIYQLFIYLADVPFNIWFWVYIFLIPVIIFSLKPTSSTKLRVIRIILAIALCYLLINLAVHLKWSFIYAEVAAIDNPTDSDLARAAADGANLAFTAMFGWVMAIVYVGWWELIWRFYYKKNSTEFAVWYNYSNITIAISIIITILTFYLFKRAMALHVLLPPFLSIFPSMR